MATELEIKLSVSEQAQASAAGWLTQRQEVREGESATLVNRYFDTPGGALNTAKAALRVRKAGDVFIQTLKTRGEFVDGAHARQEWEWTLDGPDLDLSLLADTPLSRSLDLEDLKVVFETNFQRQVLWQTMADTTIEIAVDSGVIIAGNDQRPLHEIEFELKAGSAGRLVESATALAREVPVFLNLVSKAEQGYFLAGIYSPAAAATAGPLTVTEFLQQLSQCWLLNTTLQLDPARLELVLQAADAAGCRALFDQVLLELQKGANIRQLSETSVDLGLLQLQLAGAGRA